MPVQSNYVWISLSSEGTHERICTAPKDLKAKAREMGPP